MKRTYKKTKRTFLFILLLLVSFTLSVVTKVKGGLSFKKAKACWSVSAPTVSGGENSVGGGSADGGGGY